MSANSGATESACGIKLVLEGLHIIMKGWTHTWKRLMMCQMWNRGLTFDRKMNVEHHINKEIHTPNILRFWIKI